MLGRYRTNSRPQSTSAIPLPFSNITYSYLVAFGFKNFTHLSLPLSPSLPPFVYYILFSILQGANYQSHMN